MEREVREVSEHADAKRRQGNKTRDDDKGRSFATVGSFARIEMPDVVLVSRDKPCGNFCQRTPTIQEAGHAYPAETWRLVKEISMGKELWPSQKKRM